jgi:hypothetical protein
MAPAQSPPPPPSDGSQLGRLLVKDANSETYLPDHVPIIYADGIAQVGLGSNVAKLTLYHAARIEPPSPSSPNPREIRVISHTVALPVNALIEAIIGVLRQLKSDPDVNQKLATGTNNVMVALDSVSFEQK